MIEKIVLPASFQFDEPVAKLIHACSKGLDKTAMEKRAAVFDDRLKGMALDKNASYVHVITTGDGALYGPNANSDWFNGSATPFTFSEPKRGMPKTAQLKGGLREFHKTFSDGAYVYRHHSDNKNPDAALGKIAMECYNEKMGRGELIIQLDNKLWEKELEKIAREEPVYWSMGAVVPFDTCSVCSHQRRTVGESCSHIADHPLELTKLGHQVFAINDCPKFHDISCVFRPADKIAFALRKVASRTQVVSSHELALLEGFRPPAPIREIGKLALLRKLAAVEADVERASTAPWAADVMLAFSKAAGWGVDGEGALSKMAADLPGSFAAMSRGSVVLPIDMFLKLVMGDKFNEIKDIVQPAKDELPGVFRSMLASPDLPAMLSDDAYEGSSSMLGGIGRLVSGLMDGHSLAEAPLARRISITIMRKPAAGMLKRIPAAGEVKEGGSGDKKAKALSEEYGKYLLSALKGKEGPEVMAAMLQKVKKDED
jgi:hypothetical protein